MFRNTIVMAAVAAASTAPAPAQSPATPESSKPHTRNVAIIVHEGVELLDFAGPGEVFAAAARRGAPRETPWFNVYTVAPKSGIITAQGFVKVEPQYTIENCPRPDILVIPGGQTNALLEDSRFMDWVRDTASGREITMSVCTGAFVLAHTGLLDGKEATTHWGSINGLRNEAKNTKVRDDVRLVDNGSVITTAGVSAGIDGALHVVARLLGRTSAEQTARYMQYEWHPDQTLARTYSQLNPQLDERGRALQQADILRQKEAWPEAIKAYEALTKQYPDDADAWYLLGYCVHASGDIDRAIDIHRKAASFNYRKDRPLYNLACAYALKGDKDKAFAALTEAMDAGWNSPAYLQGDDDWKAMRDDPRFAAAIKRMSAGGQDD